MSDDIHSIIRNQREPCNGSADTWWLPSPALDALWLFLGLSGTRSPQHALMDGADCYLDMTDLMRLHPSAKTSREALEMQCPVS